MTKKQKHNSRLLLGLLGIFFIGIIFTSCEAEKDFGNESSQGKAIVRPCSMKDASLLSNAKLIQAANKLKNLQADFNSHVAANSKLVYDQNSGLYYDDEKGVSVEKNGQISYVFPVIQSDKSEKIKNITFNKNDNNEYDIYLVKYDYSKEDLNNYTKEELATREQKYQALLKRGITYPVEGQWFVCSDIVTITTHTEDHPNEGHGGLTFVCVISISTSMGCVYWWDGGGGSSGSGGSGNGGSGGGGGGGTDPTNPTNPPPPSPNGQDTPILTAAVINLDDDPESETPCEKIKRKTSSVAYMNKFNAINTPTNFNLPYETGFVEKKYLNATQYIDGTSSGASGGSTMTIPSNAEGFTHVHNNHIIQDSDGNNLNATVKILSPADLAKLITTCRTNCGTTPEDAYGVMISDEAIFSLTLLDGNIDMVAVNSKWDKFAKDYKRLAERILNDTSLTVSQRNQKLQKMMLSLIDSLGLKDKVGLFEGNVQTLPNGTKKLNWTRKTLDDHNNLIPTPC